jgi:hypothetical protein
MISRKVFISSTTKDLGQYRDEAEQEINKLNNEFRDHFRLEPITMDNSVQSGERETAVKISQQWVSEADWIILIVGWNYGYIAPDQQLSVTELEYHQALNNTPRPKRCFVFIAGDPETDGANGYTYNPNQEKTNLHLWASAAEALKDMKRWDHICRFRKELQQRHHALFPNIIAFREELARTLRRAIVRLITMVTSILQFTNLAITSIEAVRTLANLKRIHDLLHNIRQFGIRRWREEVLVNWVDHSISADAQITYLKGLIKVDRIRGTLVGLAPKLPGRHNKLAEQLNEVIKFSFGDDAYDLFRDRTTFERSTNLFARQVQAAFSASNGAMQESAQNLRPFHAKFQSYADPINLASSFSQIRGQSLAIEFRDLANKHETLRVVLSDHNQWQKQHDLLERADVSRGSSVFDDELFYLIDKKHDLCELIGVAETRANANLHLNGWKDLANEVRKYLVALVESNCEANRETAYEGMRKAFDDLFFEVDKETLRSVEVSEQRVIDHEKELMRLKIELEH